MNNSLSTEETIAAIATPPGEGAVAIIRLSGPRAWPIAETLFSGRTPLVANKIHYGWLKDPKNNTLLDEVLLLAFKAPKSFTGEDVVEFQCHGGQYLSKRLLSLCLANGAVAAPPGAFSKRAFLNGKLDLSQAESILDLIAAQNDQMLAIATGNLQQSVLGGLLQDATETLLSVQASIVASVDFPDEVDEPDRLPLHASLLAISQRLAAVLSASNNQQPVREGIKVAIVGLPNAGKSSLFNALIAKERAIVTDIPGTTRDTLEASLLLANIHLQLTDTAGLRDTIDTVEALGVERSIEAATAAHLLIHVVDAEKGWQAEDTTLAEQFVEKPALRILNKVDLLSNPLSLNGSNNPYLERALRVSAMSGQGLKELFTGLETHLTDTLLQAQAKQESLSVSLNQRQSRCLEAVLSHVSLACDTLINEALPIDLVTVPLSDALNQLDALSGRDLTEAVLSDVFARFCVGK